MEYVYKLEHMYEVDNIEEIKFIGVFSSIHKAEEARDKLMLEFGFKDHPVEFFYIDQILIDHIGWCEGFISWNEASRD